MTGRQSGVAVGGSSGGSSVTLKTHSLEVSRSKAIAQVRCLLAASVPQGRVAAYLCVSPATPLSFSTCDKCCLPS
jgi:hypothetical protein